MPLLWVSIRIAAGQIGSGFYWSVFCFSPARTRGSLSIMFYLLSVRFLSSLRLFLTSIIYTYFICIGLSTVCFSCAANFYLIFPQFSWSSDWSRRSIAKTATRRSVRTNKRIWLALADVAHEPSPTNRITTMQVLYYVSMLYISLFCYLFSALFVILLYLFNLFYVYLKFSNIFVHIMGSCFFILFRVFIVFHFFINYTKTVILQQ